MQLSKFSRAGLKSFISASATRELGEFTSASVSTSWHPQAGLGLSLTTARRLSQQTESELTWQVGPESCMTLGITRQGQKYLVSGRLEVHCLFSSILHPLSSSCCNHCKLPSW